MAQIIKPHFSDEPNEGEKRLIKYLKENLPDNYLVITNGEYSSKTPQGVVKFWEYDCIVITPHAIYHIENKDWGGHLEGDDDIWFVNGAERKNPHKNAALKSKILGAKLHSKNAAWFAPVYTAITLSHPQQTKYGIDPQCDCFAATYTLLNGDLAEFIQDSSLTNRAPELILAYMQDIADYLSGASISRSHQEKTEVLDYKILETLQQTDFYTEYLCEPKSFVDKKYKVREYPLDFAEKSANELAIVRNRAENAKHAQEQLSFCPNIIPCHCQINDARTKFYEVIEYMDDRTLYAEMRIKTFTQRQKIQIILDVANALKEAHSKGVFHRAVAPENIYIVNGGSAALANFNHSWYVAHQEKHFTVASLLTPENESPYTPPEFEDMDVCAASDIYSLGVIFYKLMTDKLPFENTLSFRSLGTLPEDILPSRLIKDLPEWVDEFVRNTIVLDPEMRWQSADEIISFLTDKLNATDHPASVPNTSVSTPSNINLKDLKPGDQITSVLTLYEELGKGGFGRVFKALHTIQNKYYAVKLFDRDASVNETYNEFKALENISHPNIVKFVYNDVSKQGFFYTLMELLKGENLSDYTKGDLRLPLNEIYKMAKQILSALVYLQDKVPPVYHRDIKPNNIVWDNRQRYVLIDFNISSSNDESGWVGTRPYVAPDLLVSGSKVQWDNSADTFSLGITLYELLAHTYPWAGANPCPKVHIAPEDIRTYVPKISEEFANFVMKSIITDRHKRFTSAKEMLMALETIGEDGMMIKTGTEVIKISGGEQTTIDVVDYINSLYSQSIHGNSGTRVNYGKGTAFDVLTYTKTKLDTQLLPDIKKGQYRLIIVTGNAGDGKTAFIKQVEKVGKDKKFFTSFNGASFKLGDIPFQSNYDGSQDEEDMANDDVLSQFFMPFYNKQDYSRVEEGRIIAINEGRLVDFLHTQPGLKALSDNIEDYFYQEGHTELLPGLMVINLNLRSVTARNEEGKSLLSQQIKQLTNPAMWGKCQGCPIADRCFIHYNVETFQDSNTSDEVITRLEWLLRSVVYKRELHITMRDLRSFIAFMLTRDYSCEQVRQLVTYVQTEQMEDYYWQYYYFNITSPAYYVKKYFPLPNLDSNDRLVRLLRETDIARVALPAYDRDLYYTRKKPENYLIFTERMQNILDSFNAIHEIVPGWDVADKRDLVTARHQSFIRHQYFEGNFDYKRRLPYRYIADFAEQLRSKDDEQLHHTKRTLAIAISASEGCDNLRLMNGYLLLAGSHVKDPLSKSYRRFSLDEFELFVNNTKHLTKYIEYESENFVFRHKIDKFIRLTISLDLFEMLQYIRSGFSPSVNDLRGRFVELQIFKNMLESKTYNEILVTKNDKKFSIIRLSDDKKIYIEPFNPDAL